MRAIVAIALMFAAAAPAAAEEHLIDQKDLAFSQTELTIAPGDRIKFTNSDRTSHHVWTKDNGVNFSSKTLKRGEAYEIKFDKTGTYTVSCHIHPKMKLKIIVEPSGENES